MVTKKLPESDRIYMYFFVGNVWSGPSWSCLWFPVFISPLNPLLVSSQCMWLYVFHCDKLEGLSADRTIVCYPWLQFFVVRAFFSYMSFVLSLLDLIAPFEASGRLCFVIVAFIWYIHVFLYLQSCDLDYHNAISSALFMELRQFSFQKGSNMFQLVLSSIALT